MELEQARYGDGNLDGIKVAAVYRGSTWIKHDHTQYKTVVLKHEGDDERFEYSGTNGFTAWVKDGSEAGH